MKYLKIFKEDKDTDEILELVGDCFLEFIDKGGKVYIDEDEPDCRFQMTITYPNFYSKTETEEEKIDRHAKWLVDHSILLNKIKLCIKRVEEIGKKDYPNRDIRLGLFDFSYGQTTIYLIVIIDFD